MTSTYEQATARARVRGRSGDGVGCAPPVGDTAPLDTVAIKPRLAPRQPGQPNKPSPHRSVTVGGVNPRGERLFGVDRPAVTGGADQSPRGESMRVRGRSGDGVGCAPPVGDTAPLDTVAIKPRLAPRQPGQPNKPSPHRSVTVGGVNPRGERLFGVDRPAATGGADQSPRGESMRVRGRSGDGIGCAPPVGDTAPLDTLAIKPRLAPRQPGQPNKPSPHRSVTVGGVNPRGERLFGVDRPAATGGADQSPHGESMLNGAVEAGFPASSFDAVAEPRSVGVVGLGYVGLPTAIALAESGIAVLGCDISEARLAAIKAQRVDLLEGHLARLGRLLDTELFTLTSETSGLNAVDTVLICVPTPVDTHLVPDLTALWAACAAVVEAARPGQTIVLTSTTYVGCTQELLVEPLRQRGLIAGRDLFVAFSPERIDPGSPSHIPEHTPRVVGGVTEVCTAHAVQTLAKSAASVHTVSCPEVAELTKLLENTFRAVNIALANEFASIARELDIDVTEAICAAATKPYGFMPFYPGPGVGGHCIPCDPHYLLWQLKASKLPSPVIEAAMASIAARPHAVVSRAQEVLAEAGRALAGSSILIVGVAYKPAVADVRESPALQIIDELVRRGAEVSFTDVMVESVRTASGPILREPDPASGDWDLVIAHTLHPGADHSWLSAVPKVLDATYKLPQLAQRSVL